MKVLATEKSKFLTMAVILLMGIFSMTLLAQNKEESKFDQLKGKVEKITVKVDGKEVVFEGKDAEKLADKMKSEKRFEIITDGKTKSLGNGEKKIVVYKTLKDSEQAEGENETKVKVDVKEGKKIINVTTVKDGKEETKTYEGEDADKFLKDQKDISVFVTEGKENGKGNVFFYKKEMNGEKMGMHSGGKMKMRSGCCCSGGCGMNDSEMPEMGEHKMMMKMKDGNCDSNMTFEKKVDVKVEKKEDKKSEKKTEKK